jgi:dCTP deaminase
LILSDRSIRKELLLGELVIDPMPLDWQIQPASVELTLGDEFLSPYEEEPVHYSGLRTILPGECLLATTREWIEVPFDLVGRVEGKSSWGRRFLMIHSTAGFIDPGFHGNITLELVNLSRVSQALPVGDPICQISFQRTDTEVQRPYGSDGLDSHYQDQLGVTPSSIPWN